MMRVSKENIIDGVIAFMRGLFHEDKKLKAGLVTDSLISVWKEKRLKSQKTQFSFQNTEMHLVFY